MTKVLHHPVRPVRFEGFDFEKVCQQATHSDRSNWWRETALGVLEQLRISLHYKLGKQASFKQKTFARNGS